MKDLSPSKVTETSAAVAPLIFNRPLNSLHFSKSQRLLFISDLHLEPSRRDITNTLFALLDKIRARQPLDDIPSATAPSATVSTSTAPIDSEKYDALFILGDFFEVWIGDDHNTPLAQAVADRLRLVAEQGTKIYFMRGNRDFLLGEQYCKQARMTLLDDITLLTISQENGSTEPKTKVSGKPHHESTTALGSSSFALIHGDQLCTDDLDYMSFRAIVRDPAWQEQFLSKTIPERVAIARSIRQQSQQRQQEQQEQQDHQKQYNLQDQQEKSGQAKSRPQIDAYSNSNSICDVCEETVLRFFQQIGVITLIHGHTHRPAFHEINQANDLPCLQRVVLGDWDQQGWLLTLHQGTLDLAPTPLYPKHPE